MINAGNVLICDLENTVCEKNGKSIMDPYDTRNELVMGGLWWINDTNHSPEALVFNHDEYDDTLHNDHPVRLQEAFNKADLVVFHNAQHDLKWLKSVGVAVRSPVWCTMIGEYILNRGVKHPLSMDAVAERRGCARKSHTLQEYLDKGTSVRSIPLDDLTQYQIDDLQSTGEIFLQQADDYLLKSNVGLLPTLRRANQTCVVLVDMCHTGFKVDRAALNDVRREYEQEKYELEMKLDKHIAYFMGDVPINLNSPAQMSSVIYSRTPKRKDIWPDLFDRQRGKELRDTISRNTDIVRKKKANRCKTCNGKGKVWLKKKNGELRKKPNNCQACDAVGVIFTDTNEIAGLKFNPKDVSYINANGFATGKDQLTELAESARMLDKPREYEFLTDLIRLSAISSYLSNFVEAIDTFTRDDGFLHVVLTQTVTSTARFSGREPNMQNMPRGNTFPVKKVFVSRWVGGKVLDADFAQLEFRGAAFLSRDTLAFKEIVEGFDVHSFTRDTVTNNGMTIDRQEAKPHTFAPLYGATAYGKSPPIAAYYTAFINKYEGIADWHKKLANEALTEHIITLPTGRQYAFPDVHRRRNGQPSHFTQIKNYPVQGFATADIVPMVLCIFAHEMAYLNLKSVIVNSVHDSIIFDVHPDEIEIMCALVKKVSDNMRSLMLTFLAIDMDVPLQIDAKIGDNWLDTDDVSEYNFDPLNRLYNDRERKDINERSCFDERYELRDDGCGYGHGAGEWESRYSPSPQDQ